MFSLIILFIFGFMAAIFAVQNTQLTSVQFGQYGFTDLPLFAVVLGAVLLGVFVSWLISLTGNISASMTLRGKDAQIRDTKAKIQRLEDKNHELALENERLRGDDHTEPVVTHEPEEHRTVNPFVKIRQRFS
jgi:uncharacterized integral membrane protein